MWISDMASIRAGSPYLILDHDISDIFDQSTEFVRIVDIVKKTFDWPLFCQLAKDFLNCLQFPGNHHVRNSIRLLIVQTHCPNASLLTFSLTSPGKTDSQSNPARVATRPANDS